MGNIRQQWVCEKGNCAEVFDSKEKCWQHVKETKCKHINFKLRGTSMTLTFAANGKYT